MLFDNIIIQLRTLKGELITFIKIHIGRLVYNVYVYKLNLKSIKYIG